MPRLASRITIREMEIIQAILTYGTMSRAAGEMHISQPAISRMVKHAEERTGLQLFERRGSKLIPTPDLTALGAEFERVFASVDRVQNLTWALGAGLGRPIYVSTMSVLAKTFLTPALVGLRGAHPRISMAIQLNHRNGVEQAVIREEADIGLLHGVFNLESLTAVPICTARVVCLIHRDHPLAAKSQIGPRDLAGETLVAMGRISPLSQQVIDAFDAVGLDRRIGIQIADSGLAAHLCAHGLGVALLDPFFLRGGPPPGLVIRAFAPLIPTECFAIFRNRRVLPDLQAEMLERLKAAGSEWERDFIEMLARPTSRSNQGH